tara:strand:- start:843 stop:1481 length:639 start_codon:yes stop_codon:yes gene_type:complete
MSNVCPVGQLCINYSHLIIFTIIISVLIIIYFKNLNDTISNIKLKDSYLNQINNHTNKIIEEKVDKEIKSLIIKYDNQSNPQSNLQNNSILKEPSRQINIPSRGEQPDIQQIGILSKIGIDNDNQKPGTNDNTAVLPLLGSQTYRGSNKWIYYTASDKYNQIKIPLSHKGKSCDEYGCDELYDGDQITIPELNGIFNVKMYNNSKLRYIPYI